MSWYAIYYLGYRTKDNKIYPLGPYDCFGKLHPVLERSRSFASDMWREFFPLSSKSITDELIKVFACEDGEMPELHYLPLEKLPSSDYIRRGYFLIEDIQKYLKGGETWDLFYEWLTPEAYAMKMEAELKFGIPKPKKDCEGEELEVYSCGEYGYFAYPDYLSEAYESSVIKTVAEMYEYCKLPEGAEIVVLMIEG